VDLLAANLGPISQSVEPAALLRRAGLVALTLTLPIGLGAGQSKPQTVTFRPPKPKVHSAIEDKWLEVPLASVPASGTVTLKGDRLSCTWRLRSRAALPAGSSGVVLAAGYGDRSDGSRLGFRLVWLRGAAEYASEPRLKGDVFALVDIDGWRVVASGPPKRSGLNVTGDWRVPGLRSVTMMEAEACYVPAGSKTPVRHGYVGAASFRPRSGMTWTPMFPPGE
jgi:hypothetical protein